MYSRTLLLACFIGLSCLVQADDQAVLNDLTNRLIESGGQDGLLFWSQDDRRVAFKNMTKIGPTRKIASGDDPYPLGKAPMDFSRVTYLVEGQDYALSDHLEKKSLIGMIVVKDDKILMEHYAPGNDETSVWISFSVTKSVTSMLIGAAIQDGYIESVDEPVVNYLPRLRGTSYEKSTIKNVLNMASGARWNEDYADPNSDVAQAGGFNGLQLVKYLGTLQNDATPGEKFNYNTGETNLVGEILRAAIGNNAATYITHKIWRPFGMGADAYWSLGAPGGGELGGCCISATLRDYARLGIFALHDGRLRDGTRVLPEGWMTESTAPSKGAEVYGYLWWLFGDRGYAALGIFGQTIRIYPQDNLVIAVHSNAEAAVGTDYHKHHQAVLEAIRDFVTSAK